MGTGLVGAPGRLCGVHKLKPVWLADQARRRIELEARRYALRETGGPLFGYEAEDGSVVVEAAHPAGPRAKHGRFRYQPDREAMQRAIDQEIAASDGSRYLVGEWHSHPLGRATPSERDKRSLLDMAANVEVGLSEPLALIQATRPWGTRIWSDRLGAWAWDVDAGAVVAREIRGWRSTQLVPMRDAT